MSLRSRASNMRSATDHPDVVDEYLRTDLGVWRAPFSSPLHYDRFMLVLLVLFPKTINLGSGALIWTSPLHSATALTTAFQTILFVEIRNCGRRDLLVSRFGSWSGHGKIRRDSRLSQYPHPPPFCVTIACSGCLLGRIGLPGFWGLVAHSGSSAPGFFFFASAPVLRLVELLPTVVAGHLWGHAWAHLRVQFLCDNMAVVGFSSLGSSCRPASACHSSDPVITPRSASLISQCYALLARGTRLLEKRKSHSLRRA